MTTNKQSRGKEGESLAVAYLKSLGFKILERNFKKRYGEIDIVALDPSTSHSTLRKEPSGSDSKSSGQSGPTLVFVEVKTRWSMRFGPPEEAVTPMKLKSIIKTAHYYKSLHPELPEAMRIDVVAVDLSSAREGEKMRLIKNVTG